MVTDVGLVDDLRAHRIHIMELQAGDVLKECRLKRDRNLESYDVRVNEKLVDRDVPFLVELMTRLDWFVGSLQDVLVSLPGH